MRRLSTVFDEFLMYLKVEKEAAPKTISSYRFNFSYFVESLSDEINAIPTMTHFTTERIKKYHYALAERGLQPNTIRTRLATLGSFAKWSVRNGRLAVNPLDQVSRPKRKRKFPRVPTWESIELLLSRITDTRDRALLALLAYGGLRRAEVVKLDMKDYVASFGLRRVQSKGGNEDSVPLPEVARHIIDAYIREQRGEAQVDDPLFVVRF